MNISAASYLKERNTTILRELAPGAYYTSKRKENSQGARKKRKGGPQVGWKEEGPGCL